MSTPQSTRVTGRLVARERASGWIWYVKSRVPGRTPYERTERLAPAHLSTGRDGKPRAAGGAAPEGILTRKQAEDALSDYLAAERSKVEAGQYTAPSSAPVTFGQVADAWLAVKRGQVLTGELAEQTVIDYEGVLRNHLRPELGELAADSITTPDVLTLLDCKRRDGCGVRSLERQVVVLNAVLRSVGNLAASADAIKQHGGARPTWEQDPEAYNVVDGKQVERIAEHMPHEWSADAARVAFLSGARKGELVELRVKDVLWTEAQLRIARAWKHRVGKVGAPKSGHGRRVPLSPDLAAILDRLSEGKDREDLLLTDEHGQRLNPFTLLRHLRSAARDAGLAHLLDGTEVPLRWHDLRASFCTWALIGGHDLRRVQLWAGHASITTTQKYLRRVPVQGENITLGNALNLGGTRGESAPVAA